MKMIFMALWMAMLTPVVFADETMQPAGAYQFAYIPGNASTVAVTVRVNTTSGQSALTYLAGFINIADNAPPGAGQYRIFGWASQDGTARSAWGFTRVDLQSGRLWWLNYDGKTAASWQLATGP